MRRVASILAFVLLFSALSFAESAQEAEKAAKESAKAAFKKGIQAEARQDYEAAYEYYHHAYNKQPSNLKYRLPYERTRFLGAASKVHRALKLRDQGKLQDALTLLEQAAAMDPSNDLAAQEIRHTQEMMQKQAGGEAAPPKHEEEDILRKRLEEARPPVRLSDISNQQLSALEFATEDTKVIYETIGKLAGINVLFDPDYTSRRLPIKLQKVTLQEALDIVSLQSRTFWRPVTPNTIFVAADTPTKRRELEQNVIKTFYLGNVATATDLQDIVNAIRTVLEVQRIQQIPSQNAIIIKATPDQLALAEKMVDDIDKGKPEVVVDVIVAQVRRDKLREIGITPPQTASVQFSNGATTTTTGSGTNGSNTNTSSNFPNFNDLQHLNSTNYQLSVGPVVAKLLFSDDNSKILQSPRIRATDNEKAVIKIGDKLPIATGSFGTPVGVGAVGAGLGVNTQFTYTEVGVKLEITPHIHPEGQITLKTALEVSNKTGDVIIGGIDQPVISQRTADQTMTLNDGEINFMGGILEDSEQTTRAGTPFLGQIPVLRYLFSDERKEKITNEIVFLLIPHIVRRQELTPLNTRPLDVGTGPSIDLHIAAKPVPQAAIPVQPAAPGPSQPPAIAPVSLTQPGAPAAGPVQNPSPVVTPPQVQPAAPQGAAAQPASGAPGEGASLRLASPNPNPAQGSTFALNVVLAHGQDVATFSAQIVYDPKVVQFVSATQGEFLTKDGQPATPVNRDDPGAGRVTITVQRAPGSAGVSGEGTVFNLMFLAKAKGTAAFSIVPAIRNPKNEQITVAGAQAVVTVN